MKPGESLSKSELSPEHFEAWALTEFYGGKGSIPRSAEGYLDEEVDNAWSAWQVASVRTAALVEALREMMAEVRESHSVEGCAIEKCTCRRSERFRRAEAALKAVTEE